MSVPVKGLDRVIFIEDPDEADTFLLIGAAVDVNITSSRETAPSKTQSSEGSFMDMAAVGFSQLTLNIVGLADLQQTHSTETLCAPDQILETHLDADSRGIFRIVNTVAGGNWQGPFIVSEFSSDGPQSGLITFNFTLQSSGTINRVGIV